MEELEIVMGALSGGNNRRPQAKMSKIKIGPKIKTGWQSLQGKVSFSVRGNGRRNTFSQDFHGTIEC